MAARKKSARKSAKKAAKKSMKRSAKKAARKTTAKRAVAKKAAPKKKSAPKRKYPETLRVRAVSPSLTVSDVQKSVAWYRDVAGFHVGEEWKRDGVILGVEVMAGAARFYLNQDDWSQGRDRKKGVGFRLHLSTAQSVDEIATGIKQRGGKLDTEPTDTSWGTRQFSLTDPDGFKISISTE